MNVQLARDPLKNGHPGGQGHLKKPKGNGEKQKKNIKKRKNKKKEAFPYESSIGEIRLIIIIIIIIIIIFFISSTCEEHTNKAQLHKQERNIEHIYIIYIIGLVLIF